ncbi:MAG: UDP-diphosphatase [Dehalococcoidia bacterium]|nr:UDP-diphosphatase [Dehalococcoidia bacterium]
MPVVETLQAALLGLVQGLTEFLPVSSSGHLLIVPWLLGWTSPLLNSLTFDVALHLGTLGAVLVYFRREWWALARALVTAPSGQAVEVADQRRLAWLLVLGSVPAGVAGLLMNEVAETLFRHPIVTAVMLVTVGLLMWVAELHYRPSDRIRKSLTAVTVRDAAVIGMAQVTALIPGVSRSGITIIAGLTTGLSRETAARFSFLLGTPVIAGAGVLKIGQLLGVGMDLAQVTPFLVGMLLAFAVGYGAIALLLAYVRERPLHIFVIYRLALAALVSAGWYLGRPWPWPWPPG